MSSSKTVVDSASECIAAIVAQTPQRPPHGQGPHDCASTALSCPRVLNFQESCATEPDYIAVEEGLFLPS